MNTITIRARLFATALVLLTLPVCSDARSILGPDNQVQVSNNTDAFHWQASSLSAVTDTRTYSWTVTTNSVSVSHANAALTGGTATLTLSDGDGNQVYAAPLSDASNGDTTTAGNPGTWTVIITLRGATTNHINFQLASIS